MCGTLFYVPALGLFGTRGSRFLCLLNQRIHLRLRVLDHTVFFQFEQQAQQAGAVLNRNGTVPDIAFHPALRLQLHPLAGMDVALNRPGHDDSVSMNIAFDTALWPHHHAHLLFATGAYIALNRPINTQALFWHQNALDFATCADEGVKFFSAQHQWRTLAFPARKHIASPC